MRKASLSVIAAVWGFPFTPEPLCSCNQPAHYESSAVPKSTGTSVNHTTETFAVGISRFYLVKTVLPCVSPSDIARKASFARSIGRT